MCAHLNGQYGLSDMYMGVPVKLGKRGIMDIIEIDLNEEEKGLLNDSAKEVRELMSELDAMKLF